MLRNSSGHEYSPHAAIAQKAVIDKVLEELEEIREQFTLQAVVPQPPLVEFFRRLQLTTEELRRVRNSVTQKGQL